MKAHIYSVVILLLVLVPGCNTAPAEPVTANSIAAVDTTVINHNPLRAEAINPKEIPVLCYHQVRERTTKDSKTAIPYIIPPERFTDHMQLLHDSGYHVILPDQLLAFQVGEKALPPKPIIITFDDGTISQLENALPVLEKYDMKAVFFIMTVTIGKSGYLDSKQIRALHDKGHTIGCHTWDHHKVTGYTDDDWGKQLTEPTRTLKAITQAPVHYFAYPYGVWNRDAITHLQASGYKAAFQLSGKKDPVDHLFTIRRIIADGQWSAGKLDAAIKQSFH